MILNMLCLAAGFVLGTAFGFLTCWFLLDDWY